VPGGGLSMAGFKRGNPGCPCCPYPDPYAFHGTPGCTIPCTPPSDWATRVFNWDVVLPEPPGIGGNPDGGVTGCNIRQERIMPVTLSPMPYYTTLGGTTFYHPLWQSDLIEMPDETIFKYTGNDHSIGCGFTGQPATWARYTFECGGVTGDRPAGYSGLYATYYSDSGGTTTKTVAPLYPRGSGEDHYRFFNVTFDCSTPSPGSGPLTILTDIGVITG
jgi:hypothetical protein